MDAVIKDKRFSHVEKDPRFRSVPQSQRKTKIDKRFQSMFHDDRFKLKYSVDKRGKKIDLTTDENLRKYYELSDSSDEESDDEDSGDEKSENSVDEEEESKVEKQRKVKQSRVAEIKQRQLEDRERSSDDSNTEADSSSDKHDSSSEEEDSDSGLSDSDSSVKGKSGGLDLARGEGNIETSDEDSDDTDIDSGNDEAVKSVIDHKWGELDKDVPDAPDTSRRLALCNMNWDRIKASDIFVLLQSFVPTGGAVSAVYIYPSEYGLERMKKEAVHGPSEIVEQTVDSDDDDNMEEDEDGNVYSREKLRQYQLNRLKYYYAVVECDSVQTASNIYDNCDGLEYETSAAKLDLRFIPDEMTFDQKAKDSCMKMPDSSIYTPSKFLTTALCQLKVDLTWDETDHERVELTTKKFTQDEVKEDNFKAYLNNSSDEEEVSYGNLLKFGEEDDDTSSDDDDKQINKYRSLLNNIKNEEEKKNDNDVQMEISWEPGLREATEKIVKKKTESKEETPWDQYLKKKKEKKKKKKEKKGDGEEAKALPDTTQEAFSDDELPDNVDLRDPFFTEENDEQGAKKEKKKNRKKKNKSNDPGNVVDEIEEQKSQAELALLMMDETEDNKKHFNISDLIADNDDKKKKKKKKKLKKNKEDCKPQRDDTFQVDVKDPRFEAVYSSSLFNVDPSAPEYKKTKGMQALIDEKIKRRKDPNLNQTDSIPSKRKHNETSNVTVAKKAKDAPLSALIKSVKANTEKFKMKKTKR